MNCGVCVTGTGEGEFENEYYGILREVIEIEYPGEPLKKCVLLNCDWFDPTPNRGMRVNKSYGIVEIRHDRRYNKYDPFILAYVATQVYYMSYPQKIRTNYLGGLSLKANQDLEWITNTRCQWHIKRITCLM